MTFDSRKFRDTLGQFATGITVVTTLNENGEKLGVTVNSFSSLSLEPPLILFNLARDGGHCREFEKTKNFNVNILNSTQQDLSDRFASQIENRFDGIEHSLGENGGPVFDDCLAVLECSAYATHDGGDHVIFVGRVTSISINNTGNSLIYYKGSYREL
jgi:flavin reductase (DIM6/NTAB) family NADH-FMN oxidoreductase RutF